MNKTSLLGYAIKYMEYLQERVRMLEQQAANQAIETVVLVKKSQITVEEDGSNEQILPEIKARVCNKNILVKIECGKRKGVVVKLIDDLEKLNLAAVNNWKFGPRHA